MSGHGLVLTNPDPRRSTEIGNYRSHHRAMQIDPQQAMRQTLAKIAARRLPSNVVASSSVDGEKVDSYHDCGQNHGNRSHAVDNVVSVNQSRSLRRVRSSGDMLDIAETQIAGIRKQEEELEKSRNLAIRSRVRKSDVTNSSSPFHMYSDERDEEDHVQQSTKSRVRRRSSMPLNTSSFSSTVQKIENPPNPAADDVHPQYTHEVPRRSARRRSSMPHSLGSQLQHESRAPDSTASVYSGKTSVSRCESFSMRSIDTTSLQGKATNDDLTRRPARRSSMPHCSLGSYLQHDSTSPHMDCAATTYSGRASVPSRLPCCSALVSAETKSSCKGSSQRAVDDSNIRLTNEAKRRPARRSSMPHNLGSFLQTESKSLRVDASPSVFSGRASTRSSLSSPRTPRDPSREVNGHTDVTIRSGLRSSLRSVHAELKSSPLTQRGNPTRSEYHKSLDRTTRTRMSSVHAEMKSCVRPASPSSHCKSTKEHRRTADKTMGRSSSPSRRNDDGTTLTHLTMKKKTTTTTTTKTTTTTTTQTSRRQQSGDVESPKDGRQAGSTSTQRSRQMKRRSSMPCTSTSSSGLNDNHRNSSSSHRTSGNSFRIIQSPCKANDEDDDDDDDDDDGVEMDDYSQQERQQQPEQQEESQNGIVTVTRSTRSESLSMYDTEPHYLLRKTHPAR